MVSVAVKRHEDHSNPYKVNHLIGNDLQFRGLTHNPGGKHGDMLSDMVLEK